VEVGFNQVILARAVFGLSALQASVATTERTALAAVTVTALAACAGAINENVTAAAAMTETNLREIFTASAYG
jgi:hypothetical protein